MTSRTVSVILPVYNRGDSLRKAMASVLTQTYLNVELIVVDDSSEEDILSVVTSFRDSRVIYLRTQARGGAAIARNVGIKAATGEFLAFQDSDDYWLVDKLEYQLQVILEEKCDLLINKTLRLVGDKAVLGFPSQKMVNELGGDAINQSCAYVQGWMMRRKVAHEVGLFDGSLDVCEDIDMLIRVLKSCAVSIDTTIVAISMQGEDSVSKDRARFSDALSYILDKHNDFLCRTLLGYRLGLMSALMHLELKKYSDVKARLKFAISGAPRKKLARVLFFLFCISPSSTRFAYLKLRKMQSLLGG